MTVSKGPGLYSEKDHSDRGALVLRTELVPFYFDISKTFSYCSAIVYKYKHQYVNSVTQFNKILGLIYGVKN